MRQDEPSAATLTCARGVVGAGVVQLTGVQPWNCSGGTNAPSVISAGPRRRAMLLLLSHPPADRFGSSRSSPCAAASTSPPTARNVCISEINEPVATHLPDSTTIDLVGLSPVNILRGGLPCEDVSAVCEPTSFAPSCPLCGR